MRTIINRYEFHVKVGKVEHYCVGGCGVDGVGLIDLLNMISI